MTSAHAAEPGARSSRTSVRWWIAAALAAFVALYSLRYVVLGERAYVPELAASFRARPWLIAAHTLFGPVALLTGLANLLPALRRPPRWAAHRWTGRAYAVAAVLTGAAGLGLSAFAAGGSASRAGFAILAILTIVTTARGYQAIRLGLVTVHREWMLRSYALVFGAVTLRLWLPVLMVAYGGHFLPAYRWVAWLSWVPNLLLAEWMIRRGWHPRFRLDPGFVARGSRARSVETASR